MCVHACVCSVCLKMRKTIVWPFTKHIIILSFVILNTKNTESGPLPKKVCVCMCVCVFTACPLFSPLLKE